MRSLASLISILFVIACSTSAARTPSAAPDASSATPSNAVTPTLVPSTTRPTASPQPTSPPPTRAPTPSPTTHYIKALAAVTVDRGPYSLAATGDVLWVGGDLGVTRVDTASGRGTMNAPGSMAVVAAGPAGVWMASYGDDFIAELDPTRGTIRHKVPVVGPVAVGVDDRSVWVYAWRSGTLDRYDAITRKLLASVVVDAQAWDTPFGKEVMLELAMKRPDLVVSSLGVWIATVHGVVQVDATSNKVVRTLELPPSTWRLAYGAGSLWALSAGAREVVRIDPATGSTVATVAVTGLNDLNMGGLVVDGSTVWAATRTKLTAIDVERNIATEVMQPAFQPGGLVVAGGEIWAAAFYESATGPLPFETLGQHVFKLDRQPSATQTALPAPVENSISLPVKVTADVPYVACEPGQACDVLDIHVPAARPATPAPVAVLFHGYFGVVGRWFMSSLADALARKGQLVYNALYTTPSHLACAIMYARATAADLGGDPSRVILVGHSDGANFGSVLARGPLSPRDCAEGVSTDPSSLFGAVLLDGGALDPGLFQDNPGVKIRFVFAELDGVSATDASSWVADLRPAGFDADGLMVEHASHTDPPCNLGSDMPTQRFILELAGLPN